MKKVKGKTSNELIIKVNKVKINLLRDLIHDISMQFVDASVDEKLIVKRVLYIIGQYYYK